MSDHEFDARLTHIEEQAGAMQERVDAYRDQSLSLLFHESEWSQEKIASKVGKSDTWVCFHLRFGRFLSSLTTGKQGEKLPTSIPKNLTERKFRSAWEQTEASGKNAEAERFRQVLDIFEQSSMHFPKRFNAKLLIDAFAGKGWFTVEDVLGEIDCRGIEAHHVNGILQNIRTRHTLGYTIKTKNLGRRNQYKLVKLPAGEPSDQFEVAREIVELRDEVMPIVKEIKKLSSVHPAELSPNNILHAAVKLERIFERLEKLLRAKTTSEK